MISVSFIVWRNRSSAVFETSSGGTATAADRGPGSASPRPTACPAVARRARRPRWCASPRSARAAARIVSARRPASPASISNSDGAAAAPARRPRRALGRVHLGVDRGAESRNRDEPGQYASSPAATSGRRSGPSGVRAAAVAPPPKESRFQRKKNASRDVVRHARPRGARAGGVSDGCGSVNRPPPGSRLRACRWCHECRSTRSTNSGSRCISFGGRCGAGRPSPCRIVPGAEEKTRRGRPDRRPPRWSG